MFDTVIRGGTVVDGSGNAPFTGDVGIRDGRIAQVGGKLGPARRDIDATGAIVDGTTLARAQQAGLDPNAYLTNNDAYTFFDPIVLIKTC